MGGSGIPPPFTTLKSTFERFKKSISPECLPSTFKHAVQIVRSLGIRYLWIDSVCIIQDDEADWNVHSKCMENVFKNAYFVLAATCASGSSDGFLGPRKPREVLSMKDRQGTPYFVCSAIDDFHADVEESELNSRGWALRERALAHRTIYFTKNQVYFECGQGVHCETLTRMRNNRSGFLGDPEFPHAAISLFEGGRIRLYEEIYTRYSRLNFTHNTDRPVAINGLETRLIHTFATNGGYGIFQDIPGKPRYLARSLLWKRSGNVPMQKIKYSGSKIIPSWSWMAYDGVIEYVQIPFDAVQWSPSNALHADRRDITGALGPGEPEPSRTLNAEARVLSLAPTSTTITFDTRASAGDGSLECVVTAWDRYKVLDGPIRYYVLVVEACQDGNGRYQRVGAGYVTESEIDFHDSRSIVIV